MPEGTPPPATPPTGEPPAGTPPPATPPTGEPPAGTPPPATPPPSGTPPTPPSGEPPAGTPPSPAPSYFDAGAVPQDWRQQLAGDDKTTLNMLERVKDFPTFVKNYVESVQKIRTGELSSDLPENPTPEQLTEWREANGVPADAKSYELNLAEGLQLDEMDQRIMTADDGVLAIAHKHNVSTEAMSELASAMIAGREKEGQLMVQQDGLDKQSVERMLRDEWGADYEANNQGVKNLISRLPDSVREAFTNSRMGNGMAVFNSPEVMSFLADIERQVNPIGTVVPDSPNGVKSMNDEIAAIEARIGDETWHKDKAAQDRYMQLLDARAAHQKQTGN